MGATDTQRIAKNTFMLYFRMLLTMLVTLYTSRVVLEILGVEDFGIYNVVGGIVVMFSFLNGTMASATQRFLAFEIGRNDFERLKKTFSLTLTIHVLIAFIILILAETIGLWFLNTQMNIPVERMEAARWVFQFSIFTSMIGIIQVPYNAAIIARERMNIYAYISIIEVCLKLLIVFMLTWISFDELKLYALLIFIVSLLISSFYKLYCVHFFKECVYHWAWDKELCQILLGYAGWNLIGNVSFVARTQGINILLNIFLGPAINAARGIAVQVNTAITSFVANFQLAVNPQIIKSYASKDILGMNKLIMQSSKYSFLLLYILALPLLLETDYILKIWLTVIPNYGVLFCRLMIISTLIDTLSGTLLYGVLATGKVKKYQLVMSCIFLFNMPLSYISLKLGYSPEYTIYVEMLLYVLALFARLLLVNKLVSLSIMEYFKKVIIKCLLVVTLSCILPILLRLNMQDGLLRLFCVSLLSLISSIVLIYYIALYKSEKVFFQNMYKTRIVKIIYK